MPYKPVAVVAAMAAELWPLLGKRRPRQVDGVDVFELPNAVIAVAGMGEKCARRAAEVAIGYAQPKLVVAAGIAGAVSPRLKVGDVGRISEVVDVVTGVRYRTAAGGEWVLVTAQSVNDAAGKRELLAKYGADVVDMEGAAVAQVAQEQGLEFAAVKSISDDAGFVMPPLSRFIGADGRFDTGRFLFYVALRPRWWPAAGKLGKNSKIARANLCRAVEHLLEGRGQ